MKLTGGTLFWMFIWSLFMGITVISIGVGALYPPINHIAGPVICPSGRMTEEKQVYVVSPVETVTTITSYCVDESTGRKTELSIWPTSLFAGTLYGFVLFVVTLLGIWWFQTRRTASRLEAP